MVPRQLHESTPYPFPLASEAVRDAYRIFENAVNISPDAANESYRHMTKVNHIMDDFGKGNVIDQTYDAAMLGSIANHLYSKQPHSEAAAAALGHYFTHADQSEEESIYVAGLLADNHLIDQTWNEKAVKMYDTPYAKIHTNAEQFEGRQMEPCAWVARPMGSRALGILELRTERGVNIESLLIRDAEVLHNLRNQPANNAETLREAHMANFMLAPFAEITAYDGLAMALQSEHFWLKNQYTGREYANKKARDVIESMGNPVDFTKRTNRMLNGLFGVHIGEQVLTHMSKHGIIIVDGFSTDTGLRTKYRRKTEGSLARKLDISSSEIPMDVVGVTVNTETKEELAHTMKAALARISEDPRYTLHPSPSRPFALHIKGTYGYIQAFQHVLGFDTIEEMKRNVDVVLTKDTDTYQVAKITLKYQEWEQPLPEHVEVQFVTKSHSINARIGSTSHALHKLMSGIDMTDTDRELRAKAIEDIKEIHENRDHVGDIGLTPKSQKRAQNLYKKLKDPMSTKS